MNNNPLVILSGPSGAGKSTLCKKLFKKIGNYYFSISTTTREPRNGEENGVDYYFTSKEKFKQSIASDEFLEWAEVHGNYYGTSKIYINQALASNKITILDIDVQGQKLIKQKNKNIISIFISTSSLDILKQRLISRQTDSIEQINKRLSNAISEIAQIQKYDFFIVNDDLETAFNEFYHIIMSCKNTFSPDIDIVEFKNKWQHHTL